MRYSKKNHRIYLDILKNKKLSEHTKYPVYAPSDPVLKELFWGFTHFKTLNWYSLLMSRSKPLKLEGLKLTKADLNRYIKTGEAKKTFSVAETFSYLETLLFMAKYTNKVHKSYYLEILSGIVKELYIEER